jgi:hypothetical protein
MEIIVAFYLIDFSVDFFYNFIFVFLKQLYNE